MLLRAILMINLKEECDSLGITIAQLVDWSGTPRQTLKDWCVKHPKRVNAFLKGYSRFSMLEKLVSVSTRCSIYENKLIKYGLLDGDSKKPLECSCCGNRL